MVSKLDPNPSALRGPSRHESPTRETISKREPHPLAPDPDLRVTLSAASRRLSDPTDRIEAVEASEASDRSLAPEPVDPPAASAPIAATARDAYREVPRPVLGERVSIRV